VWELRRLALPLPTLLPSYNQIGFDSLHYLIGMVEPSGDPGRALAWVVGGKRAAGAQETVVDPATKVLFPLEVAHDGGLLTMQNLDGFSIEFNRIRLPFQLFRVATRVNPDATAQTPLAVDVVAECAGITFYGQFLRQLGFCNPQTDVLNVFGAAELAPFGDGVQAAPAGVGTVDLAADAAGVTATLSGTTLRPDAQVVALLVVDATTGAPVPLDYGYATTRTTHPDGTLATVRIPFTTPVDALPTSLRAYLMVDTYPAARADLVRPPA
jgi:hypothetical protein